MFKKLGPGKFRINGTYSINDLSNMISDNSSDYRSNKGERIASPGATREFLGATMEHHQQEVFMVIFMDNRHRVICSKKMFFGTIDGASVHPREIVRKSLEYNAAAVIFSHNHPSGESDPSRADISLTHRLTEALKLIDVRVLDHLIVGSGEITSMAEKGII